MKRNKLTRNLCLTSQRRKKTTNSRSRVKHSYCYCVINTNDRRIQSLNSIFMKMHNGRTALFENEVNCRTIRWCFQNLKIDFFRDWRSIQWHE